MAACWLNSRMLNSHDALLLHGCAAGRDVYVDIAGWHLFMRDMNAVPGFKMSQALATQLGPEVTQCGVAPLVVKGPTT